MNLFSIVSAMKCLAVKFTKLCLVNFGDIFSKNLHKQDNLPAHLNKLQDKANKELKPSNSFIVISYTLIQHTADTFGIYIYI